MSSSQEGPAARARLLCVDDERQVIDGVSLQLRRAYDVVGATSGEAALELLGKDRAFSVVMSDMRMPGMDGATFLARAREIAPDSTRILLTGHADFAHAVAAVNEGGIFRFLTKPCPPADLRRALDAAVEQHRLVTAERVLLEQTLRGCVKTLTDILALTSPLVFGRASRIRATALDVARHAGMTETWALEVAVMLAQLGAIPVPEEVLVKEHSGAKLTPDEEEMLERARQVNDRFLANIPRLETVRAIVDLSGGGDGSPRSTAKPTPQVVVAAKMLRMAADFEALESRGETPARALDLMAGRTGQYEPTLLTALRAVRANHAAEGAILEIRARSLVHGMVFVDDVKTTSGALLVARGFEVNSSFLERVRNFGAGYVREPVRVMVPKRER